MSYEIEYEKKAYRATNKHGEEVFFAFVTTCSNNVDPRTPRPHLIGIGRRWEIIQKVCGIAGDCESGCWKPKNRMVSPESYIRRWRKVLSEAAPSLERMTNLRLKLTMKHQELVTYLASTPDIANPDKYRWERINELLKDRHWDVHKWYDEGQVAVEFPIKSYEDIEKTLELESHLKEVSLLCWNIQICL